MEEFAFVHVVGAMLRRQLIAKPAGSRREAAVRDATRP